MGNKKKERAGKAHKKKRLSKQDGEIALPTKEEVREAARILKSGSSKKRERRQAASVMSIVGSRKGGINRARSLTPEKRREIAIMGGLARQAKAREDKARKTAKMRVENKPRITI